VETLDPDIFLSGSFRFGHFPAQDGLFTGRTVPVIPKMAGFLKHTMAGD
jgi:hypothetical protein